MTASEQEKEWLQSKVEQLEEAYSAYDRKRINITS